ncbi:tyrosine-type recombinase/integrase [Nocardia cerradoensis]|uniref:Tyrosine recombinase XerD n=1 Tax=Nocardia cerradoensis TaxID=85688 RepID=A0A231GSP2_9NOCA|nr:site-specific integrase [Nocardia cerradoensis]NKY47964.1 site-specific integrase [Nocardia cerradoensis]OXR39643.1 Tyrosine recombinase XerD [Nocardia cerradoensis]
MSNGDGWIQKKVRVSPRTGKTTTRFIARITPPGLPEESKSFIKHGRPNEPGTAAHWLAQRREEIRSNTFVSKNDRAWTLGEWAEEWLAGVTGVDKDTLDAYDTAIRLDIKPAQIGDRLLSELDRKAIVEWMSDLTAARSWDDNLKPLAASTANGRRTVLAMILNAANDEGLMTRNPMRRVKMRDADIDVDPIDPEELPTRDQVWELYEVAKSVSPLMAEQIIVSAGTGLRPGELLGLRQRDIRDGEIHVVQQRKLKNTKVKFGAPKSRMSRRRVPIGDEVAAAIDRHLEKFPEERDEGVLFMWKNGKHWHRNTWAANWRRIRDKAGMSGMRYYILRHYYASVLIDGGASPRLVMERMGHTSSVYTLERYARLWPGAEDGTRELIDSGLRRDKNGTSENPATDEPVELDADDWEDED